MWCFPSGLIRSRKELRANGIMLAVFGATVLPYALWNWSNHGVFKATPLEGAGSYMHIGYRGGNTGYTDPGPQLQELHGR